MTADPGDARGREELTPDEFLSRIDADRDLTADELATLARLTGQPLDSLLPQPAAGPAARGGLDPAEPGSPSHWPAGPAGLGGGLIAAGGGCTSGL